MAKLLTFPPPAPPPRRWVIIFSLATPEATTELVELEWLCPICGAERGKPDKLKLVTGNRILFVDTWCNPCGHEDSLSAVTAEARRAQDQGARKQRGVPR